MEIIAKLPSECLSQEISEFIELVNQGREVEPEGFKERISRAKKLFFLKDPTLVAVGALKRFYQQYKNSIFEKAGCSDIASNYQLEMGWMYVKPESRGRGFGRELIEAMISQLNGQSAYTTVRFDNYIMHYMLEGYGFKRVGTEYPSIKGNNKIILYIRPK